MSYKLSLIFIFCLVMVYANANDKVDFCLTEKSNSGYSQARSDTPDPLKVIVDNNSSNLKIITPNTLNVESLTVYDLQGKRVIKRRRLIVRKERQVSIKGINKGLYILEIVLDSKAIITKKIVIGN